MRGRASALKVNAAAASILPMRCKCAEFPQWPPPPHATAALRRDCGTALAICESCWGCRCGCSSDDRRKEAARPAASVSADTWIADRKYQTLNNTLARVAIAVQWRNDASRWSSTTFEALRPSHWATVAAMHWRDDSRLKYGKAMNSKHPQTLPRVFFSTRPTDRALRRALAKAAAVHVRADAAMAAELRAARRRLLLTIVPGALPAAARGSGA
jgi:hypothetical protein